MFSQLPLVFSKLIFQMVVVSKVQYLLVDPYWSAKLEFVSWMWLLHDNWRWQSWECSFDYKFRNWFITSDV